MEPDGNRTVLADLEERLEALGARFGYSHGQEARGMSKYMYEILDRLIAFDTVSSKSDVAAAGFLAERFASHRFKTDLHMVEVNGTQQANLIAWAGPPRADGLIISGHVDTVPFEGQPGWTREPLKMAIEGARVYGRGVTDMKGFIAQSLEAVSSLEIDKLRRPLVFIWTSDEEVGSLGAKDVSGALGAILGDTPAPRMVWIGEPTSWAVLHAHKSIAIFEVRVGGIGGHSGNPERGVNAIAVAGRVIEAIGQVQAERCAVPSASFASIFPDSPYDVLNFGTIKGGIALNIIAEECRIGITYRSLPDVEPLEIYHEIKRRLAALDLHDYASRNHRATIEVGEPMLVPPLLSERGTTLERALLEATGTSNVGGALFSTDGGWFSRAGLVSLICGPGELAQAHQPNESIGRAALEEGPARIKKVIEKLCFSQ